MLPLLSLETQLTLMLIAVLQDGAMQEEAFRFQGHQMDGLRCFAKTSSCQLRPFSYDDHSSSPSSVCEERHFYGNPLLSDGDCCRHSALV